MMALGRWAVSEGLWGNEDAHDELDADGNNLRMVQFSDYTAEKVRVLYRSPEDLANHWKDPATREALIAQLADRGIDLAQLVEQTNQPDADLLDLLCHVAFNAPLLTRRQRAEKLRREKSNFFDQYGDEARFLAGGQSLIPLLALRLARPAVLIDGYVWGSLSMTSYGLGIPVP